MDPRTIWSLAKDPQLKLLLLLLEQRIGGEHLRLTDDVPHPRAIRLAPPVARPEVSVYVYRYAQSAGRFGVDLEYPLVLELEANDKTERLEELDLEQTLQVITLHLGLAPAASVSSNRSHA